MLDSVTIAEVVRREIPRIATTLRPDVLDALRGAAGAERSERGRRVLDQLIENADTASAEALPLCQDTGTVWVWIELGEQESIPADLQAHIDSAVAEAYRTAGLRMSVAGDALSDRSNTGDNTPALVDVTLRPGRGATVHVMLKGGGSDNASALTMLEPSGGADAIESFVVERVRQKAASACPPLMIGIGVGGTFDSVAKNAKKALLRPVGTANPHAPASALEQRVLEAVNASGIGPGGLGGDTTALAVHVVSAPSHIASLPVAVNMGCCALRSVSVDVG